MKPIYIVLIVIVLLIIIGYFTNWFGMNKNSTSNETQNVSSRIFQNNTGNKYSCPEGFSLYTNSLNGHSICVKLSTGEVKDVIKS